MKNLKEGYECDLSSGVANEVEVKDGKIIVKCKFFRDGGMCVSPRIGGKLDAPLRKCVAVEKALEDIHQGSNGQKIGRAITRIVNHK